MKNFYIFLKKLPFQLNIEDFFCSFGEIIFTAETEEAMLFNLAGRILMGESGKQHHKSSIKNQNTKFLGIDFRFAVLWPGVGKKKCLLLENWYYG